MIHLEQAVIVEGKYDKIKLKNFLDAEIITTDGYGIFRNREKLEMIRKIAEKRGIIIMTDSDSAGFVIRGRLTGFIDGKYITNVFVPEIKGKERRKATASAAGLLGVEGLDEETILKAMEKAGIASDAQSPNRSDSKLTKADLFSVGLSGRPDSKQRRETLMKSLGFPTGMSSGQFLTALNSLYSRKEFFEICSEGKYEDR